MADRDDKGRFIIGNQAARIHGGYATRILEYQQVVYCLKQDKPLSPRLQNVHTRMIAIGLLDEYEVTAPNAQSNCA